ncbi:MAG: efflux RND transporter periplasmic adaptor subunit [Phenylobacterium sp.]|uniref:efflux RND transporter periplasmic adaptor subunit n=1 Tax=Phenylobacterium sp. TaxID=1871053 RepID=UPI001A3964E6|nr:efflux RND transporter periplasmic adaptor subunit [Phenylobacterium sp.]MBL8769912.1 efflux RND transporter periplasmic adaptor subunit [Phenylobacterium sp.]
MTATPSKRRRFRLPKAAWIALGVIVLVVAALVAFQMRPKAPKDPYRFATVEQGDLTRSVSASGSLQALITVDVGSQISGQVTRVLADFNDEVRAGQTLAVIDPQTFQSRVAQSRADIAAGEAGVRQAEATLANAQADYNRKKELVDKGIYSPSTLDQATAAMRVAQAQVAAARARVQQSRATLRSQQVDLGRTTISAPIDGVVVDRKVEPGQTVAASLQAPVLFTIAQDLSKVEVRISVDEADVGQVQEGQMVRFTVDAFPDDTFEGIVTQVRKQPTTEQNVVAYTVIAEADNPQRKLLPGMTANADIVIETKRNVVKVPAAALRWTPPAENAGGRGGGAPGAPGGGMVVGGPGFGGGPQRGGGARQGQGGQRGGPGGRIVEQLDLDARQRKAWEDIQAEMRPKRQAAMAAAAGDRRAAMTAMRQVTQESLAELTPQLRPDQRTKLAALLETLAEGRGRAAGMRGGTVYVLRDGKPTPIPVRVGATDGTATEIVSRQLKPGDQVIVGGGPKPPARLGPPGGGGGGGGVRVKM